MGWDLTGRGNRCEGGWLRRDATTLGARIHCEINSLRGQSTTRSIHYEGRRWFDGDSSLMMGNSNVGRGYPWKLQIESAPSKLNACTVIHFRAGLEEGERKHR